VKFRSITNFQAALKFQKIELRKIIAWIHLWTSLIVGVFVIIVTLSGSVLVFYPEINKALYPKVFTATPGNTPLEQIYHTVQETYPDNQIEWIFRSADAKGVYRVELAGDPETYVFVDPGSGHILGTFPLDQTLIGWFTKLHIELFMGETGTWIVGGVGIAFFLMLLTGAYLWWPGLKKWFLGWSLRWKRGWYIRHYDLHKLLGIITLPILLILVLTGVAYCYYDQARSFWYAITFTTPPEAASVLSVKPADQAERLSLDQLALRAHTLVPDGVVTWVGIPADETAPAEIWLSAPFDPTVGLEYDGQVTVDLDQYSGAMLQINDPRTKPWNVALFETWLFALHIGTYGGILTRVLYLIAGLSPTILAITGVSMWLLKRKARKRRLGQGQISMSSGQQQIVQLAGSEEELDAV
jgi:uncharacterized iron-regulated membrane protein